MAGGTAPLTYAALPWRVFREGLKAVLKQQTEEFPSVINQVYTVANSNREWEELLTAAGIGAMPRWDSDGGEITYTAPQTRYLTTITALDYAYGVEYTHKLKRALMYSKVLQAAKDLGVSAMDSRETLAASLLNNGFTTAWTDAVNFFSASHPLATGGLDGNLMTGALSLSTFESAVLMLETTVDDQNRPMNLKAQALLIPPALRYTAERIILSPDDPSTANRAINPIQRRGFSIIEWPYLTSSTAWFVLANRRFLYWFDREPLNQVMEEDKRKTKSTYHNAAFAANRGAGDWRGVVGSTG